MRIQTYTRSSLIAILIVIALMLLAIPIVNAQKVEIYHKPSSKSGEFVIIKVSPKALQAHLNHGDHLMACSRHYTNPEEGTHNCDDWGPIGHHNATPLSDQFLEEIVAKLTIEEGAEAITDCISL